MATSGAGLASETSQAISTSNDEIAASWDLKSKAQDDLNAFQAGLDPRDDAAAANVASTQLTEDIGNLGGSFNDAAGYEALGSSVGLAAQAAAIAKLEALRSSLLKKRTVKIKSLLDATGSFAAQTPKEIGSNVSRELSSSLKSMPKQLARIAEEMAVDIASDPEVMSSFANLKVVQQSAKVLDSTTKLYYAVEKISNRFEPFFPIVEILINAALIWTTGGAGAAGFTSQSAQKAGQELKKIIPLVMNPLKNYIYNQEVQVYEFMMGGLERLTTQEASDRFANLRRESEELLAADDARYAEVTGGLSWQSNYANTTAKIRSGLNSARSGAFINSVLGKSPLANALAAAIAYSVRTNAARERGEAYIAGLTPRSIPIVEFDLSMKEIVKISAEMVDSMDTTSAFYANRQMQKLVLDFLAKDGCDIDVSKESYDERSTELFPSGARGSFEKINDTIIVLHTLLAAITGEQRTNIRETIPVVDFYRRENTSVLNRYTDGEEGAGSFSHFEKVTILPSEGGTAPDGYQMIINEDASLLNMAASGYPVAEFFYNTKARLSAESNIQVDYDEVAYGVTAPTADGPGLMNGLLSRKTEAVFSPSYVPEFWTWIDERGIAPPNTIAVGTRYNSNHIWRRGTIIERPFATATPGYAGKASEYYEEVFAFINALQADNTVSYARWREGQTRLDSVTYKAMWSPNSQPYSYVRHHRGFWGWFHKWRYGWGEVIYNRRTVFKVDYPSKVKNLTTINPSQWTSMQQTYDFGTGLKSWFVLNAGSANSAVDVGNWVRYFRYSRRPEPNPPANLATGSTYFLGRLTTTSWDNFWLLLNPITRITGLELLTPYDLVKNTIDDNSNPDTILYSAVEYGIPDKIYLISKKDLAINTTDKKLVLFNDDKKAMAMKCIQATHVNPVLTNIAIIHQGVTHLYEAASVMPDAERPTIKNGTPCWVYELDSVSEYSDFFRPLRVPQTFMAKPNPHRKFWWKPPPVTSNIRQLKGMTITSGLPPQADLENTNYRDFYSTQGVSMAMLDTLFSDAAATTYVRGKLAPLNFIQASSSIAMDRFETLVAPWNNPVVFGAIDKIIASRPDLPLYKLRAMRDRFNEISNIIRMLNNGAVVKRDVWYKADSLLGNSATPWLAIGDDPSDDISDEGFQNVVEYIKELLLGKSWEGAAPVKFLAGDDAAQGRQNSLYYQRYMFLNSRMNRQNGPFAQAAMMQFNWQHLIASGMFKSAQANNYRNLVDALPVAQMDALVYSPPNNIAMRGNFYSQALIDEIMSSISDKCMLVCGPCPVKNECPFYDENTAVALYVPPATTLDIWFKDNKLDLLAYDYADGQPMLDLSDNRGRLSAEQMQARHKAFSEIIHDADKEINLDEVRGELSMRVPGYKIAEDIYADGLDWAMGGRYGSLNLATNADGSISSDVNAHSYLYDAMFIRDEETYFDYERTSTKYKVALDYREPDTGIIRNMRGQVALMTPTELTMLGKAGLASDVYLISDDARDTDGNPFVPVIYLNMLGLLAYGFDKPDDAIEVNTDARWPGSADIAQWCVNQYKWMDPTPDQYWMTEVQKVVRNATKSDAIITLPGRPRVFDVVDPILTEEPPIEDILRGKPFVRSYVNFVRRMRVEFSSIRWDKSGDPVKIDKAKYRLASMKTNLRLVVVKH